MFSDERPFVCEMATLESGELSSCARSAEAVTRDQEFRREGWTEAAIILCKLNKSL
mgnify:CR=1 FL=1